MGADLRVLVTYGTRPEIIKLAPVIRELKASVGIDTQIIATGQHESLAKLAEETFGIEADESLKIMREGQSPLEVHCQAMTGLAGHLRDHRYSIVLVQGDTTSALAAAQVAHYFKIPVGHIEAGLRSHDRFAPFPEEMNRRLISALATLHFAPTKRAAKNLPPEAAVEGKVFVTGNTVIDALEAVAKRFPGDSGIRASLGIPESGRLLFSTVHRRESWGESLKEIARALLEILDLHPDVHLALALHPNPVVRAPLREALEQHDRAHLLEPLTYPEIVKLLRACYLVLSDSGGLQEEAPHLGKPVVVLRNETDRPEALAAGTAVLASTKKETIVKVTSRLLESTDEYHRMSGAANPYGDGRAADRIVKGILHHFGHGDPPDAFRSVVVE